MSTKKFFGLLLTCGLMLGTVQFAQALDRDHDNDRRCGQKVEKAEQALRNAERRHGANSRQAQAKRRQLEEARERCHHEGGEHHEHR